MDNSTFIGIKKHLPFLWPFNKITQIKL